MEQWQMDTLKQIALEIREENPLIQAGVKYVEFVSRSNGRKKSKRRKLREVRLVSYRGRTVSIGSRLTRQLEFLMQDIFPEDLTVDNGDDWLTSFINALKATRYNPK